MAGRIKRLFRGTSLHLYHSWLGRLKKDLFYHNPTRCVTWYSVPETTNIGLRTKGRQSAVSQDTRTIWFNKTQVCGSLCVNRKAFYHLVSEMFTLNTISQALTRPGLLESLSCPRKWYIKDTTCTGCEYRKNKPSKGVCWGGKSTACKKKWGKIIIVCISGEELGSIYLGK